MPLLKTLRVRDGGPSREITLAGFLLNQKRARAEWTGLTSRVQNVAVEAHSFFDVTSDPGFRKYISGEVWLLASRAAELLRERDPDAVASFLRSWSGAVDRYCHTVCEPGLVAEAVETTFADFLEKVDRHPLGDDHLESALMRSTRLTAAEAARVDWDEPGTPEEDESVRFECELTPLYLAGSPGALASVEALARLDAHVLACPRCRAGARRFQAAEEAFPESKDADAPEEVLEGLSERFSSLPDEMQAEPEAVEAESETLVSEVGDMQVESEAVEAETGDVESELEDMEVCHRPALSSDHR